MISRREHHSLLDAVLKLPYVTGHEYEVRYLARAGVVAPAAVMLLKRSRKCDKLRNVVRAARGAAHLDHDYGNPMYRSPEGAASHQPQSCAEPPFSRHR